MIRELAKAVALILSIVSIYALLGSAFFMPGIPWQQRLSASIETLVMAACVCFASGLLFTLTERPASSQLTPPVTRTLPVQLFFWSLGGTVLRYGYARSKSFVVSNGGGLNDVPGTGPKQRIRYGHPNAANPAQKA